MIRARAAPAADSRTVTAVSPEIVLNDFQSPSSRFVKAGFSLAVANVNAGDSDMRNERSISLPGLLLGFSVDGGVAAAAVPAAARTVLSLPQAALGDGTAQAVSLMRG